MASNKLISMVRRYRHWTLEEKRALLEEAEQPGSSVSAVARKYGVNQNQIFAWRKLMRMGAFTSPDAGSLVALALEVKRLMAQILEINRTLGKNTMELEKLLSELRAAVELVPVGGERTSDSTAEASEGSR